MQNQARTMSMNCIVDYEAREELCLGVSSSWFYELTSMSVIQSILTWPEMIWNLWDRDLLKVHLKLIRIWNSEISEICVPAGFSKENTWLDLTTRLQHNFLTAFVLSVRQNYFDTAPSPTTTACSVSSTPNPRNSGFTAGVKLTLRPIINPCFSCNFILIKFIHYIQSDLNQLAWHHFTSIFHKCTRRM